MDDFQKGTLKYFSSVENRLKTFRKAQNYLNYVFDLGLTMSDRMELRHEVDLMIGEACKVVHPANYQQPEQVAPARFLIINYPSLDRALIARAIVTCWPIKRLNNELKRLREE